METTQENDDYLDAKLEAAIDSCMSFLANEGLHAPNLFRAVARSGDVVAAMDAVCEGEHINFVEINDPALCTSVMKECLKRMKKPLFPVHLVQPLSEAQALSKQDPPEERHVRMKEVLTAAALAGTVSSTFLNLIGLLNLLEQNAASNGTTLSHLAATFAGDFLHDQPLEPNSPEWRAATKAASRIMMDLIMHIYRMFPPHGEGSDNVGQAEGGAAHDGQAEQLAMEFEASNLDEHKSGGKDDWVGFGSPDDEGEKAVGVAGNDAGSAIVSDLFGLLVDSKDESSAAKDRSPGQDQVLDGELSHSEGDSTESGPNLEEEDDEDDREAVDLVALAKHSYTAGDDDELSFQKDDKIRITFKSSWDEDTQEGWYTGELRGQTGLLPSTYVTIIEDKSISHGVQSASSSSDPKVKASGDDSDEAELGDASAAAVQEASPRSQPAQTPLSSPPRLSSSAQSETSSATPSISQGANHNGKQTSSMKNVFDDSDDDVSPKADDVSAARVAQSIDVAVVEEIPVKSAGKDDSPHFNNFGNPRSIKSSLESLPSRRPPEARRAVHDPKVELLFGQSGRRRTTSDKVTKDTWKKALAWYKSGAGAGGGTSPGNSTRAYPGKILSSRSKRDGSEGADRTHLEERIAASRQRSDAPESLPRTVAPRTADPSQYPNGWARKWHTKIMTDGDSMDVRSVHDSNAHDRSKSSLADSPINKMSLTTIEGDMQRGKIDALEKVHTIRSSQRSRMKLYNSSLVSVTPRTTSSEIRRVPHSSKPDDDLYFDENDIEDYYEEFGEGWEVEEDEYKYWSGNAAYRHVERQRKARYIAHSKDPWNAAGYKRSPTKIESARIGSNEGLVLEMSKAFRRAGTADNAKRGIKFGPIEQATNKSAFNFAEDDWKMRDIFSPGGHVSPEGAQSQKETSKSPGARMNREAPRAKDQRSWLQRQESLIYAVALVGLPNLLEKIDGGCTGSVRDKDVLAGPFKSSLLSLLTPKTTTNQDQETLEKLISAYCMPCGAFIRASSRADTNFSVMLPQSGRAPLALHCHLCYRQEFGTALSIKYGGGGAIYVPECIIVASETVFHDTLREALSCFLKSVSITPRLSTSSVVATNSASTSIVTVVNSSISTLQTLLKTLELDVPPPGMPLYLQIGQFMLHCPRPDVRDLPLADIDFAHLLRGLDSRNLARLLIFLLLESQIVLIADSVEHLFPSVMALMHLAYPFSWAFPVVPVLPPSRLSFLESPHPYIVGIHRSCVPRGRLQSNVLVADLSQNTLTVPPSFSREDLDNVQTMLESRITACKHALLGKTESGKSSALPDDVVAPGAYGTASAGNSSGMHAAVESLRLNIAADLSQIFFRYPLYLQTPNHAVLFDSVAFAAASEEFHDFVQAVCSTKSFSSFLNTRYCNWIPKSGSSSSRLLDVFDAKVKRRLEAEHHDMQNAEDSDLSGFLFVREEDDQSDGSCWNLKWCELGKKELKAFTFQAPMGVSANSSSSTQDEQKTLTIEILPERTSIFSRNQCKRDPTSFGFEIRVGSLVVSLCAKDKKTLSRWMFSLRKRAMGEQTVSRLQNLCH